MACIIIVFIAIVIVTTKKNKKKKHKKKLHSKRASFTIEGLGRREVPGVLGARGHGNPFIENWHAPAGGGVPC
jgi:hypothetical protein